MLDGPDELLVFAQDTALNIDATPCAFGHLASKACSPPTKTCCTRGLLVLAPRPCRAAGSVVFQISPLCSDQPVVGSSTAPVITAGGPRAGPEIVTGAPAGTATDSRNVPAERWQRTPQPPPSFVAIASSTHCWTVRKRRSAEFAAVVSRTRSASGTSPLVFCAITVALASAPAVPAAPCPLALQLPRRPAHDSNMHANNAYVAHEVVTVRVIAGLKDLEIAGVVSEVSRATRRGRTGRSGSLEHLVAIVLGDCERLC